MRDLELRGAGDLLGDEQSGHVAAVGFELYVALLDEAVEACARRARARGRGARPPRRGRRRLPAGRLHPVRGGEDRRPPPGRRARGRGRAAGAARRAARPLRAAAEPVVNLLELQRARIELGGPARAPSSSAAGGSRRRRSSWTQRPWGGSREQIPEAIYESRDEDPVAARARRARGAAGGGARAGRGADGARRARGSASGIAGALGSCSCRLVSPAKREASPPPPRRRRPRRPESDVALIAALLSWRPS